ncbi:MAG TPA: response regulator [Alphaproteobacteria bacterium]|jgi:DNA-binding response OmpR family regulator
MAKILLIDDDTLVRTSLAYALEDAGHAVIQAGNGDEGLDALARGSFDAVVLDILMPEREGIETIREIRKKWAALPVLAISGGDKTGWSDFLRMASALGANDTLAKPFTSTDFVARVSRLLEGART